MKTRHHSPGTKNSTAKAVGRIFLIALMLVYQLGPGVSVIVANPTGEQVIAGGATFDRAGSTLTINQGTDKVIINWQDFGISAGELTKFIQPSSTSAALNRVVGQNVSEIYGTLEANGQIYLINPNGLVVGSTGVINTQSFIASTHDVSNAEFLAGGDLGFGGQSAVGSGQIKNLGAISADGGDVILIAKQVENAGTISAPGGTAALAAGTEVLLKASGEQRIFIQASTTNQELRTTNSGLIEAATAELKAASGNEYALAINNTGVIRATGVEKRGGRVFLTSAGGVIQNAGLISAKRETSELGVLNGGDVIMDSGDDGLTIQAGIIDASGEGEGSLGGKVKVLGETVVADAYSVTLASGDAGGGEILIGGDFQGANPEVRNARNTYVAPGAILAADAYTEGDGGKVIIWADEDTRFYGDIYARGGSVSGDGGFVEVSGKENLLFRGMVYARAENGEAGTLLLDPKNITVDEHSFAFSHISSPSLRIPASGTSGAIQHTLLVSQQGIILDLNVFLDVDHTHIGDLIISISSLRRFYGSGYGTQWINLFNGSGGSSNDLQNVTFDDESGTPINLASTPYSGSYQTTTSPYYGDSRLLSYLDGEALSDYWSISIIDRHTQEVGRLNRWGITGTATTPYSGYNLYGSFASSDITISPSQLTRLTNVGVSVTLQASNDLTIDDPITTNNTSGTGGHMTFQAGRSIFINANITTDNGNLNLYANDLAANGVQTAHRDAGNAVITMASGTTISAGSGDVNIEIRNGTGASGDITLRNITANTIKAINNGPTTGSEVVLNGTLTASGTGDAIVLAGDNLVNNTGASALSTASGRWLVYLNQVSGNTFGNATDGFLASGNQAIWNTSYPTAVVATGNRYVFAEQPTLTFTTTNDSKTYGDDHTGATQIQDNFTVTGFIDASTHGGVFTQDTLGNTTSGTAVAASTGAVNTATVAGSAYATTVDITGVTVTTGYAITKSETGQLTVNPRPITVTALGGSSTYGDSPANPGLSATNLASFDDISDLTGLSNSFGIDSTSTVNTYTLNVAGSLSNGNYQLTGTTDGSWNVTPKALTVTANNQSKTYGDTFAFAGTEFGTSGLINGDTVSGATLGSAGAVNTASVSGSPYTITISSATGTGLGNYTIGYTSGSLNVNPRAITVTADAGQTKVYGNSDPVLAYTVGGLGLVNGDTLSGSLARSLGENVATYAITQGGVTNANNTNYNITFNSAGFSITPRPIEVTAGSGSSTYGDNPANPGISLTGGTLGFTDTLVGIGLANDFAVDSTTDAGTYGVNVTGTSSNYSITKVAGSWSVAQKLLAILGVNAQDKEYDGNINATLTAGTLNGIINSDSVMLTQGTGTFANANAGAGKAVTATGFSITGTDQGNYTINQPTGLTADITKKLLEITANDDSRPYDTTAYSGGNGVAFNGFITGEDMTDLGGALTYGGTSQGAVNTGLYNLTPGGYTSANYDINFIDGILTILDSGPDRDALMVEQFNNSYDNFQRYEAVAREIVEERGAVDFQVFYEEFKRRSGVDNERMAFWIWMNSAEVTDPDLAMN